MLWYLLYPLRGTTEAPVLAPDHPLRKVCGRYGTWAARHVNIVLPLSGTVIVFFLYLFPFLYTTEATTTNGVSHLPHHVWTAAQPLGAGSDVEPDVIMRSIWIHGSYMKAIERDVLLAALEIQDEILGPTVNFNPREAHGHPAPLGTDGDLSQQQRDSFHISNGVTNQSWFFHSPLQYWAGSAENIAADDDLIATVNEKKTQSTLVNTTLRHSIVFSGKRFEERRLVAADALVITLIHMDDSPVGRQWVEKTGALAQQALRQDGKWRVIPPDGRSASSRLYKFQFKPMSSYDWVMLTLAYTLTLANLLLRLSKLRAVKSRLGLIVTILTQIAASIVSSFTVCAIFKINLSRVPHYAYPLVVLAISIENSFKLINAVIMTSSAISTSDRIGEAFGTTAHLAIANRVQNSLLLYSLSKVTSPGVSAFCTFAAIATLFDFLYLATFFLAVLSVDVRQRELFELEKASLKRAGMSHGGTRRQSRQQGISLFRLGGTTMPTITGSLVLLGFVLIVQAHYSAGDGRQWLNQLFDLSWGRVSNHSKPSLLIDIHQARSPTSWLRLQDHETAQEVIQAIKPWAHSYVARVYDPVIFVMKGADRTPHAKEPLFLPAVYDFLHHHIPVFIVSLLTTLAALRLFTNHLVRAQFEEDYSSGSSDDEHLLSVQSLSKGHTLDVAMLAASPGGQLVSVGLDRTIQVWSAPSGSRSPVLSDPDVPLENPFPVLNLALDDRSGLLALVSWQRVFVWNVERQQWAGTINLDLGGHRPEAVFFVPSAPDAVPPLVLVRRDGIGLEVQVMTGDVRDFAICKTPLVWAVHFTASANAQQRSPHPAILTASRRSCIHLVRQQDNEWSSVEVKFKGNPGPGPVHCLLPLATLSRFLVGRTRSVDLVDMDSSTIIHTFHTEQMQPRTLKQITLMRIHRTSLASFTLSYTSTETGDLVIHTYHPETGDQHEPRPPSSPSELIPFDAWTLTKEQVKRIPYPGSWEALPSGSIIGVRRKTARSGPTRTTSRLPGLRKRGAYGMVTDDPNPASPKRTTNAKSHSWEAWVLNLRPGAKYEFETRPLEEEAGGLQQQQPLMISELGPMTRLGTMSVAVGFGDVIKVLSVGHEHFGRVRAESLTYSDESLPHVVTGRKKRGATASGAGRSSGVAGSSTGQGDESVPR